MTASASASFTPMTSVEAAPEKAHRFRGTDLVDLEEGELVRRVFEVCPIGLEHDRSTRRGVVVEKHLDSLYRDEEAAMTWMHESSLELELRTWRDIPL